MCGFSLNPPPPRSFFPHANSVFFSRFFLSPFTGPSWTSRTRRWKRTWRNQGKQPWWTCHGTECRARKKQLLSRESQSVTVSSCHFCFQRTEHIKYTNMNKRTWLELAMYYSFSIFACCVFSSCCEQGEKGERGHQGAPGPAGTLVSSLTFCFVSKPAKKQIKTSYSLFAFSIGFKFPSIAVAMLQSHAKKTRVWRVGFHGWYWTDLQIRTKGGFPRILMCFVLQF